MEQRICKVSGRPFTVTDEDIEMLRKFDVPLPTLCPEERMRRRMAFRNERILFYRPSSVDGKETLSMYRPNTAFPVYPSEYWFSDAYSPPFREIEWDRSLVAQIKDLQRVAPRPMLSTEASTLINSDYNNCANHIKNCYLTFASDHNEDCYYGNFIKYSRNTTDTVMSIRNELCYDMVNCSDCYNLKYSEDSKNCRDSWFLSNCIGCSDCLLCTNLRRSQYCILNQQYSKEEYFKKIAELNFGKWSTIEILRAKSLELYRQGPHPAYYGVQNENSVGNAINNTKNAYWCFECGDLEDCRYLTRILKAKDCMDVVTWGNGIELCYECVEIGDNSYMLKCCNACWNNARFLEYCEYCISCEHCFACVGLHNQKYCILNKQYTSEEYQSLLPRLKRKMIDDGEYGEFFPLSYAAIPYHDSIAQDYYPLDEGNAKRLGANWEEPKTVMKVPTTYQIPDDIADVTDDILKSTLVCAKSGKAFTMIKQELEFYRANKIPVPQLCFDERHMRRLGRTLPRNLFESTCAKTNKPILTPFDPARGLIVWDREEFDLVYNA